MPDQRRRPTQARSQATVAAILDAATRILRRGGTQALTTNRVAELAGVGIGSLYGYFQNKADILDALAEGILEADELAVHELLNAAEPDIVGRLVQLLVRRHRTDRVVRRIVLSHHAARGQLPAHQDRAMQMIRLVSEHPAVRSQLSGLDPATTFVAAYSILGVCRALTSLEADASDVQEVEVRLADQIRLTLQGGGQRRPAEMQPRTKAE
ncbi:TetR/AcrR family transcriptional regulator [Sulfitobacter porphyrae]|uniref:TetR/AcrR family transcriptional regulator n=1 Tax=Sulfitobacter porphyrae TaxID=1246864 RepID=A0ABW2BAH6_9RHOB|nr:hypothetical protein GCM10007928_31080 [Sulfitobacter porphyrae]